MGLKLKGGLGIPEICVLDKILKCGLSLSHSKGNNERTLSGNKKILTKRWNCFTHITVNGPRTAKDGTQGMDELSFMNVDRGTL